MRWRLAILVMGAEESKSTGSSGTASFASGAIDFPNSCRRESSVTAWTLLHQCTNEKWKEGHAGNFVKLQSNLLKHCKTFVSQRKGRYCWRVMTSPTVQWIFWGGYCFGRLFTQVRLLVLSKSMLTPHSHSAKARTSPETSSNRWASCHSSAVSAFQRGQSTS